MSMVETLIGPVTKERLTDWESVLYYFRPIAPFYEDDGVTEIMVNRFDEIYIEKNSKMFRADATFGSESSLQTFIRQVANALGQPVSDEHPELNARFPDTSRLCCTMPAISPYGATVTLRKAPKKMLTFSDLVGFGSLNQDMVDYIGERISEEDNMLISGNTGSGKTSILRACVEFVDKDCRLLTSEDTQELYVKQYIPNSIPLEAPKRRALVADARPLELADLIKTHLRQRPDHVWVGEIRDAAAANAYITVLNTGHTGCASTLHANSARDAVQRIQYLMSSGGLMDYDLVGRQVLGNVQLFIHASRNHRRYGRKVMEICRVVDYEMKTIFRYNEEKKVHEYLGG